MNYQEKTARDLCVLMLKEPQKYPPRNVYKEFYSAVLRELNKTGTCGQIIFRLYSIWFYADERSRYEQTNPYSINCIEWQAYQELYEKCMKNNGELPSLSDKISVPDKCCGYEWDVLGNDYTRTVTGEVEEVKKMEKILYALMHIAYICNRSRMAYFPDFSSYTTDEDKNNDIKYSKADNKMDAKIKKIEEESLEIKEQANNDAKRIREQANNDAKRIREQANNDAKRIREEAMDEAKAIESQAINKTKEIYQQAENDAAELLNKARLESEKEAQEKAQELIRKYMTTELNNNWTNLRQAIETEDASNQEELTRGEREREDIWAKVSNMQGDLVKSIEDAVASVTQIKQNICHELGEWRSSLHVDQFKDMIRVYTGLFRLHNDLNAVFSDAFSSTQLPEECKNEMAEETDLLISNLGMLERQMDRALSVFGMYPIRPDNGMAFDSDYHELTDKQQDEGITRGDGYHILRCVIPGVAQRYNEEMREDRILCKAKVEVDPQS